MVDGFSIREAAEILGFNEEYVRRMVRQGKLVKVGSGDYYSGYGIKVEKDSVLRAAVERGVLVPRIGDVIQDKSDGLLFVVSEVSFGGDYWKPPTMSNFRIAAGGRYMLLPNVNIFRLIDGAARTTKHRIRGSSFAGEGTTKTPDRVAPAAASGTDLDDDPDDDQEDWEDDGADEITEEAREVADDQVRELATERAAGGYAVADIADPDRIWYYRQIGIGYAWTDDKIAATVYTKAEAQHMVQKLRLQYDKGAKR